MPTYSYDVQRHFLPFWDAVDILFCYFFQEFVDTMSTEYEIGIWNRIFHMFSSYTTFDAKSNLIHAMHGVCTLGVNKKEIYFNVVISVPVIFSHSTAQNEWEIHLKWTKFYSEFSLFQFQMQLINWKWIIREFPVNGQRKFHLYSFGSAKQWYGCRYVQPLPWP